MIELWRLYRRAHGPGLDGAGGRYAAGRWHGLGTPVVYFGASSSIVVLEKLAHINPDVLPEDLMLGRFAGELSSENVAGSFDLADIDHTRAVGEAWFRRGSSCVLRVPSVVVPEERNLVFNPRHVDAPGISLVSERDFVFDARLL